MLFVVLLFVVMVFISVMERFKVVFACCVLNFILYFTFYVGLDNIVLIYCGICMYFSVKGWVVVMFVLFVFWYYLNVMLCVIVYLRGRLSLSLVVTGLDAFAVRRGLFFKVWCCVMDKYLFGKDI